MLNAMLLEEKEKNINVNIYMIVKKSYFFKHINNNITIFKIKNIKDSLEKRERRIDGCPHHKTTENALH